jgi:hypothetical protein
LLSLAERQGPTLMALFGSVLGLDCQPDPTTLGLAPKARPSGLWQRRSRPPSHNSWLKTQERFLQVWLTNNTDNAPHRATVFVGSGWEAGPNAIGTFWKCFGFGLSARPNSTGSGYQRQTQRLVAEKATPLATILD